MDFEDTPEEAAYRKAVREWIARSAPPGAVGGRRPVTPEFVAEAKVWQAIKADQGFAGIRRPREWGGGGGTMMEDIIFSQEEEAAGLNYGVFMIGIGMCVPTVLAHGPDQVKRQLVTPTIRGEKIWCQLFSEPSAGSDLAGIRMKAVREGDGWLINGQKVWNSFAHRADYGLLLTRTNPDRPKHKGLTMFWVDMHDPAIEVRPIHQASGHSEFNEVYVSDLRVSDHHRLGEVDEGWAVALTTLMNERMSIMTSTRRPNWEEVMELARQTATTSGGLLQDQAFREQLADWYVKAEGVRFTRFRLLTDISRGGQPGPSASVGKIINSSQLQEIGSAGVEFQDQFGIIDDDQVAPMEAIFQTAFLYSPGARLGGGTDEIMKNIIAERVLGMPGDVRVDKDTPFRELPNGAR
jgi:alkylation response protein AidB-like acyl-CoA dehydrogenase